MTIQFLLNRDQCVADAAPLTPALDFLRDHAGLTAAKAGCREGGCGACSVLLGEVRDARDPRDPPRYRVVNSCLLPMAALAGRHLVTVEGLNDAGGADLNPLQQALVDHGAIQCGFCTPGLVIALTGYLLDADLDQDDAALEALDGNLCRCTGYAGIRRAAAALTERYRDALPSPNQRLPRLIALGLLPDWFATAGERLATMPEPRQAPLPPEDALLVAGGTDLLLRDPPIPAARLWFSGRQDAWRGIEVRDRRCHIGAATTIEQLLESRLLADIIPAAHRFIAHIAATPIRDRATVAGNLINASPIGDLSVWLLALSTEVLLQGPDGARHLPLTEFFVGYKRLAMAAGESVTAVEFPLPDDELCFNFEKVAHRAHVDIAAVNSAMRLQRSGDRIVRADISAGGVAATPMTLSVTAAWLRGRVIDAATVNGAAGQAMREVAPMTDIRGSAAYKRLLIGQLLRAHFLALAPDRVDAAALSDC